MSFTNVSGNSLIEGSEYVITTEDFKNIADIIHKDAGIALHESKTTLVYSRLAKRLRILNIKNFSVYCSFIQTKEGEDERQEMLAALTTNVTRFFREPHHFEHLKTKILLPLVDHARKGKRIRLWSAACSSGQEPYSIALTLLDVMPDALQYDIKILATDIDPNMIKIGQAGAYDKTAVAAVSPDLRSRWLSQLDNTTDFFRISEDARSLVDFRRLNLIGNWPMKGPFQAIFCRNVVIYFDDETQIKIWARMVPLLDQGGALYIGHSERVAGAAERALRSDGITTYRLQKENYR